MPIGSAAILWCVGLGPSSDSMNRANFPFLSGHRRGLNMHRRGLRPRDDEGVPSLRAPVSVIASEARQSTALETTKLNQKFYFSINFRLKFSCSFVFSL